ncbi:hypothetical protein H310_04391 [Aphanomyces invadans]|uniref:FYVE-type domain-containing protein n=1 Tax=Aphanomyces invadans TaxID=157072 RepID=A0A024UCK2_9STRA|nr:hypothetical protein H310_04391 [Aphanomyces invadans]ETW03984.1 hypothetical protein H310_04391 [Aphanomyces invadans]|eukprot:XP_008866940.1 hypothetical protein H310_04391 [Aphanomyces invadans]
MFDGDARRRCNALAPHAGAPSILAAPSGNVSAITMLQLTDDDVLRMKSLGREVCTHVAYSARRTESAKSSVRWTSIGYENDVELFEGEDADTKDTSRALSYMCGETHVTATIDQVADLFNATDVDADPAVRDFYAQFHADLAHTQLIAPVRSRSRQYPRHMISLKTATMVSPSPSAATNPTSSSRDFVYLESQEDVMDAKRKKRGWVCAMHSIDLSNVPSPPECVRGSLYRSGFVFTESDVPGELEAIYLLQIDFKGAMPPQLRQAMLKQRIMCLQVLSDHFARPVPPPQPVGRMQHASPSSHPSPSNPGHGQHVQQASSSNYRQHPHAPHPDDLRQLPPAGYRHPPSSQQQQNAVDSTGRYPGNNHDQPMYPPYGRQLATQPSFQPPQQLQQQVLPSEQLEDSGSAISGGHGANLRTHSSTGQPTPGLQLLCDIQLKPKHSAAQCACCVSGFSFLKKKHNCRVCGEVVCSSCCILQRPVVPIDGIKKYYICTLCTMDSRRSVARTASSHAGLNNTARTKSENARSVLSGIAGGNNIRSPKSSLSGTMQQHRYKPPNQPSQQQLLQDPRQGYKVHLHQPAPPRGPHYPDDVPSSDMMPTRHNALPPSNMYSKQQAGFAPGMPQVQLYQPGHPRQHHHHQQQQIQGMQHAHPSSHRPSNYPINNGGYPHPSHQYHPPPPHMAHNPIPRGGGYRHPPPPAREYAASMASTNYPVPRYNGTNKPDDPRMSMLRDERESFLNLYDEVGTSVSRAQPIYQPYRHPSSATDSSLASRPPTTQEVYIPPDAPTTTAVNLGDLRNAPDVLAALNNSRTTGGASGLRLEIISPNTNHRQPEPESEPYGGGSSNFEYSRVAPLEPSASGNLQEPILPPPPPPAATQDAQLVAQQQAPGIYKGSRYRIKETRYYAPTPDASPDDYVAQERDSILVDMPSQSPAPPLMAAAASPTALTVSRFLDHDIDMFLQPMVHQGSGGVSPAPLLENEGAATPPPSDVNDLLLRLQQQDQPLSAATPDDSKDSDVVALTRLLVDRLRGATDSERAAIRGALAAAVQ